MNEYSVFSLVSRKKIEVVIPHRHAAATRAALNYAAVLSDELVAHVRLVDVRVVPYGVPLADSKNRQSAQVRLRKLVENSDLSPSIEVIYARNWEQGLKRALSQGCMILMAKQRSSWQTSEKRLAARLRKAGYSVIWVDPE